jgi:hypothetical protein
VKFHPVEAKSPAAAPLEKSHMKQVDAVMQTHRGRDRVVKNATARLLPGKKSPGKSRSRRLAR